MIKFIFSLKEVKVKVAKKNLLISDINTSSLISSFITFHYSLFTTFPSAAFAFTFASLSSFSLVRKKRTVSGCYCETLRG